MKKSHLLKSFGVLSAFAFLLMATVHNLQSGKVEKADAVTTTVYCKMTHSWWTDDGAAVGIYYWNVNGANADFPGERMSAVSNEDGMWSYDLPSGYSNIIFTRVNGSGTITNWGAQTENLTLPTDGKNCFTITNSSETWGGDPGCTGTWSTYDPSTPTPEYSVNIYINGAFIKQEQIREGELPDNPATFGQLFSGWKDSGNNAVTAITSNTSVYCTVTEKSPVSFGIDTDTLPNAFSGTLNLYAWDENGYDTAWPGTSIGSGKGTYTVPYDAKIIINNGAVQTANVESIENGKLLKILTTKDEEDHYNTEWITPSSPEPVDPTTHGQENIYDTKYGTYYQLLVYSFADGNGDGIGDFKGLIEHLDYLENLGIGGLYLSPIQTAHSYHAYDTINYYQVNSLYEVGGVTLNDVVTQCHNRNIKVILDMVLNHSHWDCSWRTQHPTWYSGSNAFMGMIDFNYDNDDLREEIKNVGQYWLNNYDVDGYRLDAVRWIYNTDSNEPSYEQHCASVEWWEEFYQACRTVKNDVYMIGEDFVYDEDEIYLYQSSGLDSLFDFSAIEGIDGGATLASPSKYIKHLVNHQNNIKSANNSAIPASFLSNHDRGRYGTNLGPQQYTLAGLMNILSPGNSYVYYGDELNLQPSKTGGWDDMLYRTPMPFASGKTNMVTYINGEGGLTAGNSTTYSGSTADADASSNSSIYAAYAKAIQLKNNNPLLYSGSISANGNNQDKNIGSYFITDGVTTMTVIYNTASTSKVITFENNITKIGDVSYSGSASVSGSTLTMAPYSVVILSGRQALTKTAQTGIYVRGGMNGWATEDDYELMAASTSNHTAKIYGVTVEANQEFKIGDATWSDGNNFGYYDIYNETDHPKPSQLVKGDNDNIKCTQTTTFNIYITSGGEVAFVDVSTITNTDGGYLLGTWNAWGMVGRIQANEVMPGEIYRMDKVPLSAGAEFKMIIYENGYEEWPSCDSTTYTDGYPASKYGDTNNCKVEKAGVYDITVTQTGGLWNYDVKLVSSEDAFASAKAYAISFNDAIEDACDYNGNTNTTTLDAAWTSMAEAYNALSNEVKAILKGDLSTSIDADLVEFNSKYNYVYSKYHASLTAGNFVLRNIQLANQRVLASEINTDTVMTVIIAVVSISALTLYTIIGVRKNKNKDDE